MTTSSFDLGSMAAHWAIQKGRVTEESELRARVRVGHLTDDYVDGYVSRLDKESKPVI